MGRVLCISSQTVYGPVGNSAAVPALQELGHEVMALPTVVLSNHPGHGKPAGQVTPATIMEQMLQTLDGLGAFTRINAVMTGYFANAGQVIAAARQIESLVKMNQPLHVLVDPVIGDHGRLYVPEDVAAAIRDHLLPLATITTPNLFELTWLTGAKNIADGVAKLGLAETIVTSVPLASHQIGTQLHADGLMVEHTARQHSAVPNGTGDFLAGCYLAHRITRAPQDAFAQAMVRLERAVECSIGSTILALS